MCNNWTCRHPMSVSTEYFVIHLLVIITSVYNTFKPFWSDALFSKRISNNMENWRANHEWAIQRHGQHWKTQKKKLNKQKTKTKTNNNNNHAHKSHKTYHHTKLTGCIIKTDEFDFSVTISWTTFLSIFAVTQLTRDSRACSSYQGFLNREIVLSHIFLHKYYKNLNHRFNVTINELLLSYRILV
jgi:hypothetical protein